ncbi:MAG TPA: hypothetical protein PKW80_14140, partial [Bacteroidales bacterium]|nr:hypothetical protein [Bacteroidales bacterium]
MGVTPQTVANGLKPYGLVFQLLNFDYVPVNWAIDSLKVKDGIDFYADGYPFRGGSFIIEANQITPSVLATLNIWIAKGVVVYGPVMHSFTAPIYRRLTSWPLAIMDEANDDKVEPIYTYAEIPTSSYTLGADPTYLTGCNDFYALPHADPQNWSQNLKDALYNYVMNDGYLWINCHAVSAIEADAPDYCGFNFLSTTGLVPWGDHIDGTPPYSYSNHGDPIMQFIGILDGAINNGSERIYIPDTTAGGWRSTTTVSVWDPNFVNTAPNPDVPYIYPNAAAILAYGPAFGTTGFIFYEPAHTIVGTTPAHIAAQRAYLNYCLLVGNMKQLHFSNVNIPDNISPGMSYPVSAVASGGKPPYHYQWYASEGTFSCDTCNPTDYHAPDTLTHTIIKLIVTDSCGKKNFLSYIINEATIVQCIMDTIRPVPPAFVDACGDTVVYTYLGYEMIPDTIYCDGKVIFKWRYLDCEINERFWTFTYIIDDTTAPVITFTPPDTIVNCAATIPPPDINAIVATDNCNEITVLHAGDVISDSVSAISYTVTRTYGVADACGNESFTSQTIYVVPIDISVSSNSPVCLGSNIYLFETGGTATFWSWTGPDGFLSDLQNPVIVGSDVQDSGTYTVTISDGYCTNIASTDIIINDNSIVMTGCPNDITKCADTIVDGIPGSFLDWELPAFDLTCISGEHQFIMMFELPENKWSCWDFNRVQRVEVNSGMVDLWLPAGTGDPYIISPLVYLEPPMNVDMDIICPQGNDFTWSLYLVSGGTEIFADSTHVDHTDSYTIYLPSSFSDGSYRLKFVFSGNGDSQCRVDNIYFDGLLLDDGTCAEGIEFNVTGPLPGFFPVGDSSLVYTATFNLVSGSSARETCEFTSVVEGIAAEIDSVNDITCSLDNGSIIITAQSSATSHNFEYTLDNGPWLPFGAGNSMVTISGLAPGSYLINVRDNELAGDCEILEPLLATVGIITDTTPPLLVCPQNYSIAGCATDVITNLIYSENLQEINDIQFSQSGGLVTDFCGIVYYSYQDSQSGNCPILVSRVFTVRDLAGNSASCMQTISIFDNTMPIFTAPADITISTDSACTYDVSVLHVGDVTDEWDNCSTGIEATYSDVVTAGSCEGTYVITRTWSLTDNCGNAAASQIQVITVQDTTLPVFTAPADITISTDSACTYDVSVLHVGDVTDEWDNCSTGIEATYSDVVTAGS